MECLHEEAIEEFQGTSTGNDASEKSVENLGSDSTMVKIVGHLWINLASKKEAPKY